MQQHLQGSNYNFYNDQFGLDEAGIHLLRSGYNYKSIRIDHIKSISIDRGRQVKNWLLLLVFGLFLTALGLYTFLKIIYEYFFADNFNHFYIQQFVFPVLPLLIGCFSIYQSLKMGWVITLNLEDTTMVLPLGGQKDFQNISRLIQFIQTNHNYSNKIKNINSFIL